MDQIITLSAAEPAAPEASGAINDFCKLSLSRKVMLRDHLFNRGRHAFEISTRFFWPEIEEREIAKLEKFLKILKSVSH